MPILISKDILCKINAEIESCVDSIYVISAFCKKSLIEYFDSILQNSVCIKKLVVRLRPEDILCGATDLELYPYCKENGWELMFRLDLHAKTYVFDDIRCIVGSANATSKGLSVGGVGNYEMAAVCPVESSDLDSIKNLFLSAVHMTDEVYLKMNEVIQKNKGVKDLAHVEWPKEILDLQKPDFAVLFAEDFPQNCLYSGREYDEIGFFGLYNSLTKENMKGILENSKCYLWLLSELKKKDTNELYFGETTALLHNKLLNDPKPYRKEVKELLANLLFWIDELQCDGIKVDRPNHSQRIRLVK